MTFIDGPHHSNQDGVWAYFVALLCKGVFQSNMLFSCSC